MPPLRPLVHRVCAWPALAALALLLASCGGLPAEFTAPVLQGTYTNPTASKGDATFSVNVFGTEDYLSYGPVRVEEGDDTAGNTLVFTDLRINRGLRSYAIDAFTVEERRPGQDWRIDVEANNVAQLDRQSNLGVVLALDVSSSLGDGLANVKAYAKAFVDELFATSASNAVAVVGFADDLQTLPFSQDPDSIKAFIDGLEGGRFTAMYDAVARGAELLAQEDDRFESRAMMIFSDGADNNSVATLDSAVTALRLGDRRINSFSVGLEGQASGGASTLNPDELRRLSTTGVYLRAQSLTELEEVFRQVTSLVTNVYQLRYNRSAQVTADPIQMRLSVQARCLNCQPSF